MTTAPALNQEVVRSVGDYVVGRTGLVVALDLVKNRAQVEWCGETKTWVSFKAIEPTSIPYEILPGGQKTKDRNGFFKFSYPKYIRK